jgi:hypothetical protein
MRTARTHRLVPAAAALLLADCLGAINLVKGSANAPITRVN